MYHLHTFDGHSTGVSGESLQSVCSTAVAFMRSRSTFKVDPSNWMSFDFTIGDIFYTGFQKFGSRYSPPNVINPDIDYCFVVVPEDKQDPNIWRQGRPVADRTQEKLASFKAVLNQPV